MKPTFAAKKPEVPVEKPVAPSGDTGLPPEIAKLISGVMGEPMEGPPEGGVRVTVIKKKKPITPFALKDPEDEAMEGMHDDMHEEEMEGDPAQAEQTALLRAIAEKLGIECC